MTRSGTAGAAAGACGNRLQCFKTAVIEAAAATAPVVENAALVHVNVADPDQDVNMKLSGRQLLIAPDADPNTNGKTDYSEAVNKLSLGGGTCFTCALQAAKRSFDAGARADSEKVIVARRRANEHVRLDGFHLGRRSDGLSADDARADGRPVRLADRDPRLRGRAGRHLLERSERLRQPERRRRGHAGRHLHRRSRASRASQGS